MDNYVGKRLDGRYEIREIIGVGGMAVVYKAYDNIDDRIVAVKILKEEFLANEEFRRRFKNESKAIAVLSHPNIVKVYDVSYGDRLQYIVMEYVEGITLKEYIEQQGKINQKEAVYFTMQILRALQHAHDKGVVHRDIKPQNIMLLQNGTIKVADFGIARFSRSETRTLTDSTIGSVHYISPEQARGDVTDDRADIYSVGVMFYEMLTGQLPFQSDNTVSVAIMQLQKDPKLPTEINPDIPIGLEQITMRAMQKNIIDRYQSAAEMLLDLEEFKRNPDISFNYSYFVDKEPTKYIHSGNTVSNQVKYDTVETPEQEEEKDEPVVKNRTIPILIGIVSALIVAVGIFCALAYHFEWIDFSNGISWSSKEEVPNFVGMNYENEIKDQKAFEKYTFDVQEKYDSDATPGDVIEQTPEKGEKINPEEETIKLTVAAEVELVTIPDKLIGSNYATVQEELSKLKLTVKTITSSDDAYSSLDENTVFKISPSEGTKVKVGSVVTVSYYVRESKSSDLVAVPDVTGISYDSAKQMLSSCNLNISKVEEYDSSVDEGYVISQKTSVGTRVSQGSTVTVVVSKGENTEKSTTVTINLQNLNATKKVSIRLNGTEVKSEKVKFDGSTYSFSVSGSGTADSVNVYADDELYYSCNINFTASTPVISNGNYMTITTAINKVSSVIDKIKK